jgi:4-hydroxy-4-methyl-2-oxoglutarate aldolase
MMHVAAAEIEPGAIVVAALTLDCTDGCFGDLLATSFRVRGANALIIDAGVRPGRRGHLQRRQGAGFLT